MSTKIDEQKINSASKDFKRTKKDTKEGPVEVLDPVSGKVTRWRRIK